MVTNPGFALIGFQTTRLRAHIIRLLCYKSFFITPRDSTSFPRSSPTQRVRERSWERGCTWFCFILTSKSLKDQGEISYSTWLVFSLPCKAPVSTPPWSCPSMRQFRPQREQKSHTLTIQMKSNNRSVTSQNQQTLQTRLRLFIRDKEAPVWTCYPKVNLIACRL